MLRISAGLSLLGVIVLALVWKTPLTMAGTQIGARTSSVAILQRKEVPRTPTNAPDSLDELLMMSPEELSEVDIAVMNLLCAQGLPGAEGLEVPKILGLLDIWAGYVKYETERNLYKFKNNPAEYNNSEADYRMLMLVTVLQQDLGVHYNMAKIRDINFANSKDQFIHGMVGDDNGGTCVSMPVLYVAIGRRLGYPLKLVLAKEHVFCRWDGGEERVNVEGAGQGMNSYPDSFYREWPRPISEQEVARGDYLASLSPSQELAVFLAARGHCLVDNGRFKEALTVFRLCVRLFPCPDHLGHVAVTESILSGRVLPIANLPSVEAAPHEGP